MTAAPKQHVDNILIGAGEMFFDQFDAAGNKTGERYLGDAVSASLAITTEETTVFSGTGSVARELSRVTRTITRAFSIVLHDMSLDNLGLFVVGDVAADAISATAVADEEFKVNVERWYQLGTTSSRPAGVNKVTGVTVVGGTIAANGDFTAAAGAGAWAANVDYVVDADSGRIYIKDTAKTKVANAGVQVDYTPAAQADRQQVKSATKQQRGVFRYIEDPADGEGRNFYVPDGLLSPGGESSLMDGRSTEQRATLAVACQEPGGDKAALYIDAQPS